MTNDQMPNYGVQTQYVSIRSTSQKQRKIITTDRTALFISKPVKCLQQREQKSREEKKKQKKKRTKEKRRKNKRRKEKRKKQKKRERRKNRLRERKACILQTFYQKSMFKNTLNF